MAFGEVITVFMMVAGRTEDAEVISILIAAGAELNPKYIPGGTPLTWAAACNDNSTVIKALIREGAEVNARGMGGMTPLMCAARENTSPTIIKILLDSGADGRLKSNEGKTAFDYAKENQAIRDSEVYSLLEKACRVDQTGEHGEWLKAMQQEEINKILSGTLYGPHSQPTVRALHGIWDTGIGIMYANPDVDLSRFEAAYVLPRLSPNVGYPTRVRLSRYLVAKQMLQPDPDDVFKARIAPLRDFGPYTPTIYQRVFLGTMDLMEAGEVSLLQTFQWLTRESERLQSEGL